MIRPTPIVLGLSLSLATASSLLAQPLANQGFTADLVRGAAPTETAKPTLEFKSGSGVSGFGGCNRFNATYQTRLVRQRVSRAARARNPKRRKVETVQQLTFSKIGATRMFCGKLMEEEQRFFGALQATRRFRLRDGVLSLMDSRNRVVAILKPGVAKEEP